MKAFALSSSASKKVSPTVNLIVLPKASSIACSASSKLSNFSYNKYLLNKIFITLSSFNSLSTNLFLVSNRENSLMYC